MTARKERNIEHSKLAKKRRLELLEKSTTQTHRRMANIADANRMKQPEDYWMVDFTYSEEGYPKWVRAPFLTWNEAMSLLQSLQWEEDKNWIHNIMDPDYEPILWKSPRIQRETDLDKLVDDKGETQDKVESGNGVLGEGGKFTAVGTKRMYQFGSLYQALADNVRSGKKSWLSSPRREKFESLTTEEVVMIDLRDQYPDGIDWDQYDADLQKCAEAA